MKKTHILGIIVIAVAMGFILSSLFEASTYADFEMAFENPGKEYHVVGTLNKEFDVIYDPTVNHALTTFHMIDEKGVSRKVNLHKSKPQEFDNSETIVLIGSADDGEFHANDILMKCPSKYEEEASMETAAQ